MRNATGAPGRAPATKTDSTDSTASLLRVGSRICQCAAGCAAHFGGVDSFDQHRAGEFGLSRRCRTEAEMLAVGLREDSRGVWIRAGSRSRRAA